MKLGYWKFLPVLIFLFDIPSVFAADRITDFTSDITVLPDSSYQVVESIAYDFGDVPGHGIFRDIPYKYHRPEGNFNVRVAIQKVVDEQGSPYQYQVSNQGENVHIRIGDPDRTITGEYTFVIHYNVQRGINYFTDHDELYWNVTGSDWEVPILKARATISLPGNLKTEDVQLKCYTGPRGSDSSNCDQASDGATATFSTRPTYQNNPHLLSYENLTVVVGIPKGILTAPSFIQQVLWFIQDNWIIFLPILLFLFLLWRWWNFGRDPESGKHIAPMYDPPKDLTPAEVGVLVDESADIKDISASLIQLAVKGYLKIKEIETKVLFFKGKDYEFIKVKEADEQLKQFEKLLMAGIFGGSSTKKLSELKDKFYLSLKDIKAELYKSLTSAGYFPSNPETVRAIYYGVGTAILVAGGFLGGYLESYAMIGSLIACGLLLIIFAKLMPRKTAKGVESYIYILGLKLFLNRAEKKQLDFLNAPEKKPEVFEKLLPYAMVLGVEQAWAKEFADMYKEAPDWYQGSNAAGWNTYLFVHSLNAFSNVSASTFVSAPSSAGSGGSGFSGGFSGGGFGGGGGGRW